MIRSMHMITQDAMERIFAVTDRLGIHRESVVVPLGTRPEGRVRRRPDGKLELTADGANFDAWIAGLEDQLKGL